MTVSVEAGPPCIQSPCILIEVDFYSEKISPLVSPVLRNTNVGVYNKYLYDYMYLSSL